MLKEQTSNAFTAILQEAEKQKNLGNHLAAIKLCEQVLFENLGTTEAYEEIGDNYLSLRKYQKAEIALRKAISLNPKSANSHYLLGFVYSAIGCWEKSIHHLDTADQIHPNHPEILRCLGWSIFHFGQRQKGVIILERALTLKSNDILILSDLGICHLNQKNFKRAETLFNRILELDPNNQKAQECLNAVTFFQKEFKHIKKKASV